MNPVRALFNGYRNVTKIFGKHLTIHDVIFNKGALTGWKVLY